MKLVEKQHNIICKRYSKSYGINPMWIISNSSFVHKNIATFNKTGNCRNVRTYDFSTLYTSIPHEQLKRQLSWVIKEAFSSSKRPYISVYKHNASWTKKPKDGTKYVDCQKLIDLLCWLIDNIYITFGDKCFRQKIGIPMGTDCAPFLANLFLYSYEFKWINEQRKQKKYHILEKFKSCCRYIDDLLMINNNNLMMKYMSDIYPKELELVPDDTDGKDVPFLDLQITIKDCIIDTKIYDKRDTYNFPIVNFPTLTSNIPDKSAYGVFIGELVRYARACTYLKDFESRTCSLVTKLKTQFFTNRGLKRAWMKFSDSRFLLIQKYGPNILEVHKKWF